MNSVGRAKRVTRNGREYVVVSMTSVVPGVLNGSKGPLYYPPEETSRNVRQWDETTIVVYHPSDPVTGQPLPVNDARVPDESKIGVLRNSRYVDSLKHDGWFDVQKTEAYDRKLVSQGKPPILPRLLAGEPVELSTGLFTDNVAAPPGYLDHTGSPYSGLIAKNYRRDHLAVLPDQVGACSIVAGCGVNNAEKLEDSPLWDALVTNGAECVVNSSGVCVNCGGKGSGTPGPCKSKAKLPPVHHDLAGKIGDAMGASAHADKHDSAAAHVAAYGHHRELAKTLRTRGDKQGAGVHRMMAKDHLDRASKARNFDIPTKNEGTSVTKTQLIDTLIANKAFPEADRGKLAAFDEATLTTLADKFKTPAPVAPVTNCGPKTFNELIATDPKALATWNTAQKTEARERGRLIGMLTANTADATLKAKAATRYEAMDTDALADLVEAQPPITNADDPRATYTAPAAIYAPSPTPSRPVTANRYDGTKAPLRPYQPETESDSPVANWKKQHA